MIELTIKKLRKRRKESIYDVVSDGFDRDYYLAHNPDVAGSGADPVQHYLDHGHVEGRDPSPEFSTRIYLSRYPDVAASGMNPFFHYLRYGRLENRDGKPAMSMCSVGLAETELKSRNGNGDHCPPRLLDCLPSLDAAKCSRLLGIEVGTLTPRLMKVGITDLLCACLPTEVGTEFNEDAGAATGLLDGEALVGDILSAAKGKTLSLDLWDTVLRRDCAPDSIKLRHARAQWLTRLDPDGPYGDLHPIDLLQIRRMAEADIADEHFEYRIEAVAAKLAPLLAPDADDFAAEFEQQELQIEKSAISVDTVLGQVLERHDGCKIVVSDFYMPARALGELLAHSGVNSISSVYSSSDHLATKRAGHLYDVVLKKEGLRREDVLHCGDRFSADVTAARKQGIAAYHYHSPSHQPRLERLEQDFWAHVGGDTTVYSRRLAEELGQQEGPIGLELLAVPATCFVLHVMEEALRRKVEKVFFFTREGVFFQRIYDLLVGLDVFDLGSYPPSAILAVSRKATFAASLDDFTVDQLMRLWSQYSKQSLSSLAASLGIDVSEWAEVASKLGLNPDEQVELPWKDRRVVALLRHPRVGTSARKAILEQRGALLDYLERAGFAPREDIQRLVVDIGWRGTIQDNLAHLVSGTIHGCYFGLDCFLNRQPANSSKTGYVFDANRDYPLRVAEVAGLEFMFNAPGGSTVGYLNGEAIRHIIPDEEASVTGPVAAMQERLLAASSIIGKFVRSHGLVSNDLVSFSREIVARFTTEPPVEVAEAFFRLSHNETFGVGSVETMHFDQSAFRRMKALSGSQLHSTLR